MQVQILRGLGEWGAAGGCGKSKAHIYSMVIMQKSNRKSRKIRVIGQSPNVRGELGDFRCAPSQGCECSRSNGRNQPNRNTKSKVARMAADIFGN